MNKLFRLLAAAWFALAPTLSQAQSIPLPQTLDTGAFATGIGGDGNLTQGFPSWIYLGDIPAGIVTGPQTPVYGSFLTGFDSAGLGILSGVDFSQISFNGVFGLSSTSSTTASIQKSVQDFTLDYDPGFKENYTVQLTANQDSTQTMYGVITKIAASPGPLTITVAVTIAPGGGTFDSWNIQAVAGPSFGQPASASFGMSTDSFAVPAVGDTVSITTQVSKAFAARQSVLVTATDDATAYFVATINTYDSSTGAISFFVLQVGGSGTFATWNIALVDLAGADADLIATSTTSITLGAGSFVFTVQSGKFFPAGSTVFITALASSTNHMSGIVTEYSGTSLTVFVTGIGVFGSGTFSSWSIYNVGDSGKYTPFIGTSSTSKAIGSLSGTFTTQSDKFFKSGTYLLMVPDTQPTYYQYAVVSSYSGTTLTLNAIYDSNGSGTFSSWTIYAVSGPLYLNAATPGPYNINAGGVDSAASGFPYPVSMNFKYGTGLKILDLDPATSSARTLTITTIGSLGTSRTLTIDPGSGDRTLTFTANATIGGTTSGTNTGDQFTNTTASKLLGRGSAGGAGAAEEITLGTGVSMSGTTLSAAGSGGTVTSVATGGLATGGPITATGTVTVTAATQADMETATSTTTAVTPGRQQYHPAMPKAWATVKFAVAAAAVTGNISSVDTATEIITWSTTHGLSTGAIVLPLAGTWPTGVTLTTYYYFNALSTTTFALYTNPTDAFADTNRVNLTASGSGTRTMKAITPTVVASYGMGTYPITVTTASTTFETISTWATAFSSTSYLTNWQYTQDALSSMSGTVMPLVPTPATGTSKTQWLSGASLLTVGNITNTYAAGTNFYVNVVAWGDQ